MMTNTLYKIRLSETEEALYQRVLEFDKASNEEARNILSDCERLATILLENEERIPKSRLDYFFEPEYNISSPKTSREEIFERNGTKDKAILCHGNFVKYLIYWINGADLNDDIKKIAEELIVNDYYKDYDCVVNFYNNIRSLIPRGHHKYDFSEEIFKLAIDAGMNLSNAVILRNKVKSVR